MEETEEVFTTFEMVYHNEAEAIAWVFWEKLI